MFASRLLLREGETLAKRLALYKKKVDVDELCRKRRLHRYISCIRQSREVMIWHNRLLAMKSMKFRMKREPEFGLGLREGSSILGMKGKSFLPGPALPIMATHYFANNRKSLLFNPTPPTSELDLLNSNSVAIDHFSIESSSAFNRASSTCHVNPIDIQTQNFLSEFSLYSSIEEWNATQTPFNTLSIFKKTELYIKERQMDSTILRRQGIQDNEFMTLVDPNMTVMGTVMFKMDRQVIDIHVLAAETDYSLHILVKYWLSRITHMTDREIHIPLTAFLSININYETILTNLNFAKRKNAWMYALCAAMQSNESDSFVETNRSFSLLLSPLTPYSMSATSSTTEFNEETLHESIEFYKETQHTLTEFRQETSLHFAYTSPPVTPNSIEPHQEKNNLNKTQHHRASHFIKQRRPLHQFVSERNNKKVSKYLNELKAVRTQHQNRRRGYWTCGLGNVKINLGNELHISECLDVRLNRDRNQMVPQDPLLLKTHFTKDKHKIQFVTLNGAASLAESAANIERFSEANDLMQLVFQEKGIQADLNLVREKSFLAELALLHNKVVGVVLFVFTEKYLWIEDVVVHPVHQGKGIGSALMNRMKLIATARLKDVLLYAIDSAESFYRLLDFRITDRYLNKYKIFKGSYMEWISPFASQKSLFQPIQESKMDCSSSLLL